MIKKYLTPQIRIVHLMPQALLAGSDPEVTGAQIVGGEFADEDGEVL